jgi:hypothetical protein
MPTWPNNRRATIGVAAAPPHGGASSHDNRSLLDEGVGLFYAGPRSADWHGLRRFANQRRLREQHDRDQLDGFSQDGLPFRSSPSSAFTRSADRAPLTRLSRLRRSKPEIADARGPAFGRRSCRVRRRDAVTMAPKDGMTYRGFSAKCDGLSLRRARRSRSGRVGIFPILCRLSLRRRAVGFGVWLKPFHGFP